MIPIVNRSGAAYSGASSIDNTLSTNHLESAAKRPEHRIEQLANLPSRRPTTASMREEANADVVHQNNYQGIRSALPLVRSGRNVKEVADKFGLNDPKSMSVLSKAQTFAMASNAIRNGLKPSDASMVFNLPSLLNPELKIAAAKAELRSKSATHWVNARDLCEQYEITDLEDQKALQSDILTHYGSQLDNERLKLSAQEIVNNLGVPYPGAVEIMQGYIDRKLNLFLYLERLENGVINMLDHGNLPLV